MLCHKILTCEICCIDSIMHKNPFRLWILHYENSLCNLKLCVKTLCVYFEWFGFSELFFSYKIVVNKNRKFCYWIADKVLKFVSQLWVKFPIFFFLSEVGRKIVAIYCSMKLQKSALTMKSFTNFDIQS